MRVLALLYALVLGLSACHSLGVGREQALSLSIAGKEYKCGDQYVFGSTSGGTGGGVIEIVVGNAGDKDLKVENIYIEEGGNAYIIIDQQFGADFFPHIIKSGDQGISNIKFKVRYTPGDKYDDRSSILVIDTDDPDIKPEGKCSLILKPAEKRPKIKVSPPNYTFVNATPAHPEDAEFIITNEGTAQLKVFSISFKNPTNEFKIPIGVKDAIIDPEGSGGSNGPVKFKVRYQPADEQPDENAIVITSNDPAQEKLYVIIKGTIEMGNVVVSYADQLKGYIDFTAQSNPQDTCSKVVNLLNEGPGPVTVKQPILTQDLPPNGQPAYSVKWFKGGGIQENPPCGSYKGEEITGSIFGLQPQRSIDILVTYVAPGAQGRNGTLEIDFENPYPSHISIQMIGGAPKGQIAMAPPPNNQVMFYAFKGEKKKRTIVIMNKGNGDLTLKGAKVKKIYEPDPDAFSLISGNAPDIIEPWSLRTFVVEYDSNVEPPIVNAFLEFTYDDPITGQEATLSTNLEGHRVEGVTLPTANPGNSEDYKGAKVGHVLILNGIKSDPGKAANGDDLVIPKGGYIWYVTKKPAGSKVFLNEVGAGPTVSILPDVQGEYQFILVVFSATQDEEEFYFSDEAYLKIQVGQ